jgi:DNA-binding MarR family transcriptional regulator
VDSLATRSLVFREVAFEDRRRILVHLSRRGRELHGTLTARLIDEERQILAPS